MHTQRIKVLIVDDSKVARLQLTHLIESDPALQALAAVEDGQAALEFVEARKPDVILMDLHMPDMDGYEVTRRIMESVPVPIIICTAVTNPHEVATNFRSMEAGAVAMVEKPGFHEDREYPAQVAKLLQTVKLMSEVKVVRRWPRNRLPLASRPAIQPPGLQFVGIGASTGGPPVLQTILAGLPRNFPIPILIVQHIAQGFLPGLMEWLSQTSGLNVQIAAHGIRPLPGHVYLAPDDFHLGVSPSGSLLLSREEPLHGLRPAVSFLFRTLAEVCGSHALGVLLTGMGRDGADELKLMRDAGAETIAQSRESSVVHGMPGAAIAIGGATHILAADKIADTLLTLVRRQHHFPPANL